MTNNGLIAGEAYAQSNDLMVKTYVPVGEDIDGTIILEEVKTIGYDRQGRLTTTIDKGRKLEARA